MVVKWPILCLLLFVSLPMKKPFHLTHNLGICLSQKQQLREGFKCQLVGYLTLEWQTKVGEEKLWRKIGATTLNCAQGKNASQSFRFIMMGRKKRQTCYCSAWAASRLCTLVSMTKFCLTSRVIQCSLTLVSYELIHFGVIARLFRQIGVHSMQQI